MNKNRVTPTEVGVVGVCTDFSCNNCKKKSNKRLLKIFAAGGLAFFMGVGTLCGVVLAPMGATSASNAGDLAALAQSADRALSPQEQLLAGTLKLDPENDPVICTTESGIEIKYAQAINLGSGDKYPNTNSMPAGSVNLGGTGYAYLKMGKYNWIIIGYNSSSTTINVNYTYNAAVAFSSYLANPSAYNSFAGSLETSTDAGALISSTASNGIVWGNYALSLALNYSSAVKNTSELNPGEVLVLCENKTGTTYFNGQYGSAVYSGSILHTAMRNLYYPSTSKNGAGFSASETSLIVQKTLTTSGSGSLTEYLFPLGSTKRASTESFAVENYITNPQSRIISDYWWLRSMSTASNEVCLVKPSDGGITTTLTETKYPFTGSIRPAMVIEI